MLTLVVRDAGPGFPADFRAVAFDRFSRPDSSRSTPGSGLGLHLVQSIALAHRGSARILDGPGAAVQMVLDAGRPAAGT
jgi:signal transduction histidine kinase